MVGTRKADVTRSRTTRFRNAPASKRSASSAVEM